MKIIYDTVIIGAGPAGIQAAIHAARKKTKVLLIGRTENSALYNGHIENYAFVDGISNGYDMLAVGLAQAKRFGTEVLNEDLLKITQENDLFHLELENGGSVTSHTVIFCMGVAKTKLGVEGEREFLGRGVSYCVDCDANFFRKAVVCVTGDRSAAVDGALTLLDYAAKVYLVAAHLNVSEDLQTRLNGSAVEHIASTVTKIEGKYGVQSIVLANGETLQIDGLFIELGSKGALQLATQLGVELDVETMRYIATNRKQETNIAGIYAAGDITGPPYQMAKAVGEGCVAGMEAASYARSKKIKTGQQ